MNVPHLFGAHLSIAGGLYRAAEAARELECGTVQLFTKTASQWAAKPITDADAKRFRDAVADAGLQFPTAHDSYLINLAAPGDELFEKSVAAFAHEIERADQLGLSYLVMHPGAHVGSGEAAGLQRVLDGLDDACRRTAGAKVVVLLEITAGMGSTLGHRFEHLQHLLGGVTAPERFGVCFDTCHAFAAGYPVHTPEGYAETFEQFDALIGLEKLKVFHLNDSVKGLNCRVDRHAGLGLGMIGEGCFQRLVADGRFVGVPMILETPKEAADGTEMDPVNLGKLRGWAAAQTPPGRGRKTTGKKTKG
jgi:deoxyribonuclease IV